MVADNGASWSVSGAPHPRWSNDQLQTLHRVKGSDFVVVDTSRVRSGYSATVRPSAAERYSASIVRAWATASSRPTSGSASPRMAAAVFSSSSR